jgi:YD repeat-containing protein
MQRLQPVAAQLVLALLSERFRKDNATEEAPAKPAADNGGEPAAAGRGKSIWGIAVAAAGAAITRALMKRFMQRRRRRTRYTYDDYRRRTPKRRRRSTREPRLEDLFRDLIR